MDCVPFHCKDDCKVVPEIPATSNLEVRSQLHLNINTYPTSDRSIYHTNHLAQVGRLYNVDKETGSKQVLFKYMIIHQTL